MDPERMSKNNDFFLWERFKSGDKKALSEIYYSNYQFLLNYGLRIYNKPAFIKDCIQELFSGLIQKLSSLGPTDNIRLYLLASFRRQLFEKLKKKKTLNNPETGELEYDFVIDASPEDKIISKEKEDADTKVINKMLNRLTPKEKEALYLKFYRNMSFDEITQIMGINYQSSRKVVYRAISSLRSMSKEEYKDYR